MKHFAQILAPGGAISADRLRQTASICLQADVRSIEIGPRMNPVIPAGAGVSKILARIDGIDFKMAPNVISSAPAAGFDSSNWVRESQLLEMAEEVASLNPHVSISLIDAQQGLVGRTLSELNFVSCEQDEFWQPVLAPEGKRIDLGSRIATGDVVGAARWYSASKKGGTDALTAFFRSTMTRSSMPAEPLPPEPSAPPYEGLSAKRGTLGFFVSSGQYDCEMLEELAYLCSQSSIGKIHMTPWHSFLIKGIQEKQLDLWRNFLLRKGIETRHAGSSLYWRFSNGRSNQSNRIHRKIIHQLGSTDKSTGQIPFVVGKDLEGQPALVGIEPTSLFRCIIYKRDNLNEPWDKHGTFLEAFAAREIQIICDQRARNQKQRSGENVADSDSVHAQPDVKASNAELNPGVREPGRSGEFVCTLCGNVYSPEVGEPFTQIAPGLAFEDLPESYACPVCGSGKSEHTAA